MRIVSAEMYIVTTIRTTIIAMDKQILHRFFKGISSDEEDQQVVEWLDNPLNKKIFEDERKMFNMLLMLDDQQGKVKPKTRKRSNPTKGFIRIAAILIFAILATGIYYYSLLEQRIESYENSIYVPVGQFIGITLSDGTKVMINGSTTIKYPAIFYGKDRRVQLCGEAFFEVAEKSDCPFIVETTQYDIQALGTEFNVEAFENSELFVVSLVKGKVKVVNNNGNPDSVILLPNTEARLTDGRLMVSKIPEHETFQWREGLITFKNATFTEIMVLFEKYFGVKIVYSTRNLPKETFSGKIRISEGINHALWVLQQNASFDYDKKINSKIITIK